MPYTIPWPNRQHPSAGPTGRPGASAANKRPEAAAARAADVLADTLRSASSRTYLLCTSRIYLMRIVYPRRVHTDACTRVPGVCGASCRYTRVHAGAPHTPDTHTGARAYPHGAEHAGGYSAYRGPCAVYTYIRIYRYVCRVWALCPGVARATLPSRRRHGTHVHNSIRESIATEAGTVALRSERQSLLRRRAPQHTRPVWPRAAPRATTHAGPPLPSRGGGGGGKEGGRGGGGGRGGCEGSGEGVGGVRWWWWWWRRRRWWLLCGGRGGGPQLMGLSHVRRRLSRHNVRAIGPV
jgi:uncharacterized membrane protein YgcG